MNLSEPAERAMYRCYKKDGVLYVPSYNEVGIYAAPGRMFYSENELLLVKGVRRVYEYLWRSYARDKSEKMR